MSKISTLEELRGVVGESRPGLEEKNMDHMDEFAAQFIARSPFIVMSTSDADGRLDASPKGDEPGFVELVDAKTLLIPDRPGNKLAYGHQNILVNPRIGLLFMIPKTQETLRVNGRAELRRDEALLKQLAARGKPAILAIKVMVEECFFHCGKSTIRSKLWSPDEWGEKHKVSFGEMFAARKRADKAVVEVYDEAIAKDYRDNL